MRKHLDVVREFTGLKKINFPAALGPLVQSKDPAFLSGYLLGASHALDWMLRAIVKSPQQLWHFDLKPTDAIPDPQKGTDPHVAAD